MTARCYVTTILAGLLIFLGATAAFNRLVDPFWFFRDHAIPGFNVKKPEFARFERHIKPSILSRLRPEAVIFGNSFAEIGFDPLNPGFTDDGALQGYNFAMAGADWNRVYCSVVFALNHTPIQRAVIGLPDWSLNGLPNPDCQPLFKDMETVPLTSLLLSVDALLASWRTVRKQHRNLTHTPEGMFFYTRNQVGKREQLFTKELFDEIKRINTNNVDCAATLRHGGEQGPARIPDWIPPAQPAHLDGLKTLLELFAGHRVEVKLLVFPLHAWPFETHILCANPLARWHSLWHIAKLVDAINRDKAANIELWDFQGTSAYLTESIRNEGTKFWQDTGHFNYEMGNVMLETMFHRRSGPLPGDAEPFGALLSEASIPQRFTEFFAFRRKFLTAHPGFDRALADRLAP